MKCNAYLPTNPDLGLLLIRLGLAAVFIMHGGMKFQNIEGTTAFFASIGLPVFMVYAVSAVEVLGGIAMLFGCFARKAGWLLAINMLFAIILVRLPAGFLGGYEFEVVLLLASLGIALIGPGGYVLPMGKSCCGGDHDHGHQH